MIPRATYRMQFHQNFPFAAAERLVPYLAKLGISHLYCSPILMARAGSTHGYDAIDPMRVNPELGGEEGFRSLVAALHTHEMGAIIDIVPNHMAVGGADNIYWLDVLEKGHDSTFAPMFDIDWEAEDGAPQRVLAPFLGKPLAETVAAGEIKLIWDDTLRKFAFAYHEHRFPVRPEDYAELQDGAATPADADLSRFNTPESVDALLKRQNFRPSVWYRASDRINWRRFFDINGLAALRVENDAVFELVHGTVFRLYVEDLIDGVRIDHIDGLADPAAYCAKLRARFEALAPQRKRRGPAYIVVEKILAIGETLPPWPVEGTTGYDFMNHVSALQHAAEGAEPLGQLWTEMSGRSADFEQEERVARLETVDQSFGGALSAAAAAFAAVAPEAAPDKAALEIALTMLLEHFRAYRTYALGNMPEPQPGPFFDRALTEALADAEGEERSALGFVAQTMRGAFTSEAAHEAARRFNQLAAPVAAKAVEDTAFYRYGRLLSRNDVGFSPAVFSVTAADFADAMAGRAATVPHAMSATATHDHKRGEDARARLAVLSEVPALWEQEVRAWFGINRDERPDVMDRGDEYQLYQALFGHWPLDLRPDDAEGLRQFSERVLAWREKSLREAKLRSSWAEPNEAYEAASARFVQAALDPAQSSVFLAQLSRFVARLAPAGAMNSLVQTALRLTCPGVPDCYQGTELWDFSFVDPDNRRPVDYVMRAAMLELGASPFAALREWISGAPKLALIRGLLALRQAEPAVFESGAFVAVPATGKRAANVLAFLRVSGEKQLLVAVPLHCADACSDAAQPVPDVEYWHDTAVSLPAELEGIAWKDALRGEPAADLNCAALFSTFPVAVLVS